MAISWGTIKSFALLFGPILLPKAIQYYRSVRSAPRVHGLSVRPVPAPAQRAIVLLAAVAACYLVRSLPPFAPENIFELTQSRLQAPTDVLFTRLASLRASTGTGGLTPRDEALRAKFVNVESRLLYLQFGPDVVADCPFCAADDPRSYLWYALPALAAAHLANAFVLAAATSGALGGRDARRWRAPAALAGFAGLALDAWLTGRHSHAANRAAPRLADLDFFHWRMRAGRALALCLLDGLLASLLYLSSTNRAFVSPPAPAERIDAVVRALASARSRINAAGIVKNTAIRDEDLRARSTAYWAHEVNLMREVMEEREVIEGVNDALGSRIDIQSITRDAASYAESVLQPADEVPTTVVG